MNNPPNKRLLSLDILRGITIAGMIMVNNPGSWGHIYAPLGHAEWIGLTPTDLVFPFFMFIMGISTYMSLRKFDFRLSGAVAWKIIRRDCYLRYRIGYRLVRINHAYLSSTGRRVSILFRTIEPLYVEFRPYPNFGSHAPFSDLLRSSRIYLLDCQT